jgi:hypothetical protein
MDTMKLSSNDLLPFLYIRFVCFNNSLLLVFNHRQDEGIFFALMTALSLSKFASTATTLAMGAC